MYVCVCVCKVGNGRLEIIGEALGGFIGYGG